MTIAQPRPAPRPPVYPAWPTSQPGPLAISPSPGQHPQPLRTDQMVYESYDQEKGIPGVTHTTPVLQASGVKISPPEIHYQNKVSEMDPIQRWLDDGGSLEQEITSEREDSALSPLVRP